MEAIDLSWRDGILLIVASAAVYLVVTLLRLTQLGRRRALAPTASPPPVPTPAATRAPGTHPPATPHPTQPPAVAAAPPTSTFAPSAFAEHLQWAALDAEVGRMRQDLQTLTEEVQVLRREMAMINSSRHVSPHYAEAMSLAQRGLTAQDVADRCGISLGEAELVIALARGPRDFAEEGDYGGSGYRS